MLLTVALHASFGCGWHHAYVHAGEGALHEEAARRGCTHHHGPTDDCRGGDRGREPATDSQAPAEDRAPLPCDEQDCEFLVATAKAFFAADAGWSGPGFVPVDLHKPQPAMTRQGDRSGGGRGWDCPLKLRAHCRLQVWLL